MSEGNTEFVVPATTLDAMLGHQVALTWSFIEQNHATKETQHYLVGLCLHLAMLYQIFLRGEQQPTVNTEDLKTLMNSVMLFLQKPTGYQAGEHFRYLLETYPKWQEIIGMTPAEARQNLLCSLGFYQSVPAPDRSE
ncbi:MAG TPA: hypothetical protein VFZ58_03290 [Candidatus Saccharimonadales bacterium]